MTAFEAVMLVASDLERVRGGSPAQGQAVPDPGQDRRKLIGSFGAPPMPFSGA
jgi:hypothetical protein